MSNKRIIYTYTDEAPALATHSFLPIVQLFLKQAGIDVVTKDISLAARVLSAFNDELSTDQKVADALAELGELTQDRFTNIIKLPNISASVPQLKATIKELQDAGYSLPAYPDQPSNSDEEAIKARYDKVKGSAVNPVLREGNSDRRAPLAVKEYAKKHPHSMGEWQEDSMTDVASMEEGDFFHNEQSTTIAKATTATIQFVNSNGDIQTLKEGLALQEGEVLDATFMSQEKLVSFLLAQIEKAKDSGQLFSLHMKATMMKVSDPIIFGEAVKAFFAPVFQKNKELFNEIGVNPQNGFGAVLQRIEALEDTKKQQVLEEIAACYKSRPDLAMVDSDKGITNLHVPSDVIIDASMPAMIRNSGKMWNTEGSTQDTLAVIPDSTYAGIYKATIDFCKKNGAFDPTTMGTVPNVGLMAQKAEEYGSHDKTFQLKEAGTVQVLAADGSILLQHKVQAGDIWRACQVKDAPIRNWVELAVRRSKASATPAVFWLDENRPHDAELIQKVKHYLSDLDTSGLEISIMAPADACLYTLERLKAGNDTISVTGNVLRDYLTDLFPILELGTSAKMLSIVPLMQGGGLFETGAGGSAPKHVQQVVKENHLRWDSLGEFLALAASLQHYADVHNEQKAEVLGKALDLATTKLLMDEKSPKRKVGELDNRGSHFYVMLYWAEQLGVQNEDVALKEWFQELYTLLEGKQAAILEELLNVQGEAANLGGYYNTNKAMVDGIMRPSRTLNQLMMELG